MPKATLTFDLPEETDDFTLAKEASNMYCMLSDISNELRSFRKYDTAYPCKWFHQRGPKSGQVKRQYAKHFEGANKLLEMIDIKLCEILKDMPEVS